MDVSLSAVAWERPLTGTVSVLPCTVVSSGIRRDSGMVGSSMSRYSVHMVERRMRAKGKERG